MQKIGLSSKDIQFYYEKIVSVAKEWQTKVIERYHPKNTFTAIEQKEVKNKHPAKRPSRVKPARPATGP